MLSLLAQQLEPKAIGNIRGIGPLGLEGQSALISGPIADLFQGTLSKIVGVMTASAIIWFVFQFIIGAYGWISAGGDSKAIEAARKRIMNAVIGIILVFGALVIISVIGSLLGINILNISQFILDLGGAKTPVK